MIYFWLLYMFFIHLYWVQRAPFLLNRICTSFIWFCLFCYSFWTKCEKIRYIIPILLLWISSIQSCNVWTIKYSKWNRACRVSLHPTTNTQPCCRTHYPSFFFLCLECIHQHPWFKWCTDVIKVQYITLCTHCWCKLQAVHMYSEYGFHTSCRFCWYREIFMLCSNNVYKFSLSSSNKSRYERI